MNLFYIMSLYVSGQNITHYMCSLFCGFFIFSAFEPVECFAEVH